jgi:hypothetical protein
MAEPTKPLKDPLSPEHKRFVLGQVRIRHWIMAAIVIALAAMLFFEFRPN